MEIAFAALCIRVGSLASSSCGKARSPKWLPYSSMYSAQSLKAWRFPIPRVLESWTYVHYREWFCTMLLPAPFPRDWLFSFYSQWPWRSQYLNPTFPKLFLHSATLESHSHLKSGQDFPYSYLDWFTIVGLSLVHHCHFIHLSLSPSPLCSYYDSMVSYGGPVGARQQDFEMDSVTSAFCLPPLLQDTCGRK